MKKQSLRIPYKRLYAREQSIVLTALKTQMSFDIKLLKKILRETNPILQVEYITIHIDTKTKERIQLELEHINDED